jgi:hypothetical protein
LTESHNSTQKGLKKLKVELELAETQPEDDGHAEEIRLQRAELRRRQRMMLELINAMRLPKDQDFGKVNAQLTDLWDQLSVKRGKVQFVAFNKPMRCHASYVSCEKRFWLDLS